MLLIMHVHKSIWIKRIADYNINHLVDDDDLKNVMCT
jgi:hypothetical protein